MSNNMAQRHRGRMQGMNNGVFFGDDFKRLKTRGVIRDFRGDRHFQRITRIGFGIDQGAINAFFIDP